MRCPECGSPEVTLVDPETAYCEACEFEGRAGAFEAPAQPTIDTATTADELLTALAQVPVDLRATALAGRGIRILQEAADLCGVGDADTLGKRSAINAILANF